MFRVLTLLLWLFSVPLFSLAHATQFNNVIIDIEKRLDARVGVAVYPVSGGRSLGHRADERFPLNSTFKAIACGGLLHRVDAGAENLERRVVLHPGELVSYSPVTKTRLGPNGMSLAELCEATITLSDNTAGNLILEAIGGPAGFTEFVRTLGDGITRLDRWETALNEGIPGDPRDTTSPNAIAESLRVLLFSDTLTQTSRDTLKRWLLANKVGDATLRAGVPDDWVVGDKTGAGGYGSRNNLAVMWPPNHKPFIVAVYITDTEASLAERNAAIADIGRA